MTATIHFDPLPSLADQFELDFRSGHISLQGQRMVLLHSGALGSLRKELIDSLGLERARGLLTRMGHASGRADALMARALMPNASDDDLMSVGPQLHSLEGIVHVVPLHYEINVAEGIFHGEYEWKGSYEAEAHLEQFGLHHAPVCWTLIGYASGFTSQVMRKSIVFREIDCRGKGNHECRIIGKPIGEWDDSIQADLRYFNPENVAEQIVELQNQVAHLRYSLDESVSLGDMVGVSPAFRHTGDIIRKAAESLVTVLLLGETGAGKEVFARALHQLSERAPNHFVAVNCAAIPEELIESELFGVEKGAFTGAQQSRPGRFERAHKGTLFLDEVAELSPAAQAKLLRVLQEGEFERVGDTRTRTVDVRLVCATNINLQEAVQDGRFRSDLYYRLNIYPVVVPPLRERTDDIPLLVERFLDKYNARHGRRVEGVTERAMQMLQRHDWPGNVRELENTIERGIILAPNGGYIDSDNLFPVMDPCGHPTGPSSDGGAPAAAGDEPSPSAPQTQEPESDLIEQLLSESTSLDDLEVGMLQRALDKAGNNVTKAARMLGISRARLAYRLKKRGIKES